ncbi:hypothetical protein NUW58_g561 [Xylaria curta]|uniref:Uncharacterized protein n=1 Tax=Xylaria curta TaxID=42375 RepID=A0ACC1PNW6_9PEZI|nr:hypothetical protein NUW58_g561 [Xylaria curta]
MVYLICNPIRAWADRNSTHRDPSQLAWPLSESGVHKKLSTMGSNGTVMVCKSLPSIAFAGPDEHTRMYRIKHRRHRPLLPQLLIHNGPHESSHIWATYKAKTLHEASVEIPCLSTGTTSHGRVKVHRSSDGSRNKYVFTMTIRGREETFGWRRSRNTGVRDLGLSQRGYKLVRLTEGTYSSSSDAGPRTSDRMQVVAWAARSLCELPRRMVLSYFTSFGDD